MYDYYQVLKCMALIAIILAGYSYLFATSFTLAAGG
jgi:hypothetical protein